MAGSMSEVEKEPRDQHQNGVDGVCNKSSDPTESDPCIEEKSSRSAFLLETERQLRDKTGLTRQGLYYVGGLIVALLLLVIIIIVLASCWPSTPHHHQYPVCNEAACLRASAQVQQYMNESVSKCDDVLHWACGSLLDEKSLPPDHSKWNQRQQLARQEAIKIRELITTLPSVRTGTVGWKLKHFYEACLDVDTVNADGKGPLEKIISLLGGWKILRNWDIQSFDFKRTLQRLHVTYGATPYFRVTVMPNPRVPGAFSIVIMPSGLGLPDRSYYYLDSEHKIIKAYKQLVRDVVINLSTSSGGADKFGNDIFFYEKRLAEVTPEWSELQNPVNTYNPIKVAELKITANTLPLHDILMSMYPLANIDEDTEVIVTHPDYLDKISQIIASTDRVTLDSYIVWTLVREYLPYLSSPFTSTLDAFNAELYGVKEPIPRWEFCINTVQKYMSLAIDAFMEQDASVNARKNIELMFESIVKVIKHRLENYKNTPELYMHLVKKMSALTLQIGTPDEVKSESYLKEEIYRHLNVFKANLFDTYTSSVLFLKSMEELKLTKNRTVDYIAELATIQPYKVRYFPTGNMVVMPRVLMTAPFYEEHYPSSLVYARLGVDIAQAIVSSVLPYESAWSSDKKLLSSFHLPVNDSSRLVRHKLSCLDKQIVRHKLTSPGVPANLTSLNTLKYLSAVKISQEALLQSLENNEHIHQPSLEKYEDKALFYLTHIQNLCTVSTQEQQMYDNLVNFQLTEQALLEMIHMQNKHLSESMGCAFESEQNVCDVF